MARGHTFLRATATFTLVAIILAAALAKAQTPRCASANVACLGGATTCTTYSDRPTQALQCGTCVNRNDGCGRVCVANADQSSCTGAEPVTCTKAAAGDGGFGIATPCGDGSALAAADPLTAPPVVTADASGTLAITLTVRLATLNATAFRFQSRLYCFTPAGAAAEVCGAPGPTLSVKPGERLVVTLVNALPAEGAYQTSTNFPSNFLRLPNTINFHTHGLHVSPRADNVMPHVAPGASRVYNISIPSSHAPGLHWYHSHMHGSSTLHVLGGMAGAIVVTYANGTSSSGITSFDAMQSNLLALTHHPVCSCNGASDPFATRSIPHLMNIMGDTTALNFVQTPSHTLKDVLLTNGQLQPRASLRVGEWRRFDILSAVGDVFLELEIRTAVNGGGSNAGNMYIVAIDGVMLTAPRRSDVFLLTMAGRVSVMVKFDAAGTYYLQSNPLKRAADFEATFRQNILTIVVTTDSTFTAMTQPTWTAAQVTRPTYLADLQSATATASFEIGVDQTGVSGGGAWLGVGANCTLECGGRGGGCTISDLNTFAQCPHVAFPGSATPYRFVAPVCSTVQWTINGRGATPHPLHIHAHHFQLVNLPTTTWGVVGDWRDTWPAVAGRSVVRFVAADYTGAVMIHCHFLMHEDMGMMDRIWIGATGTSTCAATSLTNNCDSAAPAEAFAEEFAAQTALVDCSSNVGGGGTPPTPTASGVTVAPTPTPTVANSLTLPPSFNSSSASVGPFYFYASPLGSAVATVVILAAALGM